MSWHPHSPSPPSPSPTHCNGQTHTRERRQIFRFSRRVERAEGKMPFSFLLLFTPYFFHAYHRFDIAYTSHVQVIFSNFQFPINAKLLKILEIMGPSVRKKSKTESNDNSKQMSIVSYYSKREKLNRIKNVDLTSDDEFGPLDSQTEKQDNVEEDGLFYDCSEVIVLDEDVESQESKPIVQDDHVGDHHKQELKHSPDQIDIVDSILCPFCSLTLDDIEINDRILHVNNCIPRTTESKFTYKSRKSELLNSPTKSKKRPEKIKAKAPLTKTEGGGDGKTLLKEEVETTKRKREKKPIPEHKILRFENDFQIAVDAFCYAENPQIDYYILTHFHSDHYGGMTKNWCNGSKIICSTATANLAVQKFKINEEIFIKIEIGESYTLIENDTNIKITCIDANHCPGSAIFIIESLGIKYLHCGDFRINRVMIDKLFSFNIKFDKIYLDTTYCQAMYNFPKQEVVVESVSKFFNEVISKKKNLQTRLTDFFTPKTIGGDDDGKVDVGGLTTSKDLLVCIGTYFIGKERIALDLAKKLGTKIYCNFTKRETFKLFEWPELMSYISDDPFSCKIHIIPLRDVNKESLSSYLNLYRRSFKSIIGISPTGWAYRPSIKWMQNLSDFEIMDQIMRNTNNSKSKEDNHYSGESEVIRVMQRQFKKDQIIQTYQVPYSEHSSFRELSFFCCLLEYNEIIPTVNMDNPEMSVTMAKWIELWRRERDKKSYTLDMF